MCGRPAGKCGRKKGDDKQSERRKTQNRPGYNGDRKTRNGDRKTGRICAGAIRWGIRRLTLADSVPGNQEQFP
ncbi:hypothetical protein Dda3937_04598 [Dickeya dadantii 3937]|uniref:Uncharacterized protein n=1 Tax=Dickeya dadantii (strain 3937) TaxID=198628 RepID=E0SE47_DICD3|nr:hypothetical protein Dda3937_04598 [Dickeya dadantii 3937]